MGLVRVTAPATEPITVLEATRHIRLDETMVEPTPDAPVVALAASGAGAVDNGEHRYRLTFVTADGETDGGDISAAIAVADHTTNGIVSLSALSLGGSAVTGRRVYRTKANQDSYFLVATIGDNATRVYADSTADAALGAGIPAYNTTGDPLVRSLIVAGREFAERFQGRALVTQQWRLTLDGFPSLYRYAPQLAALWELESGLSAALCFDPHREVIRLPKPPLLSVDAITYVDETGATQTLDPSQYIVDATELRGEISRAYGTQWPATRRQPGAVSVLFTCGYGAAADVPEMTKQAIKLLVSHWYMNREAFVEARFALEVPFAVDSLLWLNRALEAA